MTHFLRFAHVHHVDLGLVFINVVHVVGEQFWRLAVKAEHEARQAFDDSFRAFVSCIEESKQQGRLSAVSQDAFDYSR